MFAFGVLSTFCWEGMLGAQIPEPLTRATAGMTAVTLAHEAAVLVSDSLRNRPTPSEGLNRAARYVAAEFHALGMRPASRQGDLVSGTGPIDWIRYYPLPSRKVQVADTSSIVFLLAQQPHGRDVLTEAGNSLGERRVAAPFGTAARFVLPRVPEAQPWFDLFAPPAVLLTGRPTPASLRQVDFAQKVVLYVPPVSLDTLSRQQILEALYKASVGVVVLSADDGTGFATSPAPLRYVDAYLQREGLTDLLSPWIAEVRDRTVEPLLTPFGVDLARARMADTVVIRDLPGLRVRLVAPVAAADTVYARAPNVLGVLEGNDPVLKKQCLVVTAPLDQRQSDSTSRMATDASAVSLAGLLQLARAFHALPDRPKASVAFLALSGGGPGQGFLGSRFYAFYAQIADVCTPTMAIVLDLSTGAAVAGDSVVIAGLDDVDLAHPPALIAALYPGMGLTVANGGIVTQAAPRSDAWAFSQRSIPSLLIQGSHPMSPPIPAAVDREWAARVLRLVFYLSEDIANADQWPHFSAAARDRIFQQR